MIYIGSDNLLWLYDVYDVEGEVYLDGDATVTLTLYESDRTTAVTGASALTMTYDADLPATITDSAADTGYKVQLPGSLTLSRGSMYHAKITVANGGKTGIFWHSTRADRHSI